MALILPALIPVNTKPSLRFPLKAEKRASAMHLFYALRDPN